ncbi:MAG: hydantoinase/oxoprolinase family protein [Planctomycetes bacterium]|nr:hydantoinase/oxoprolinase family protein [Planctomycetota bacterium]
MGGMRVGIDVGGTFTDVVLIDVSGGRTLYAKVLTTPANPAEGVMRGIARILEIAGVTMAHLDYVVHGHGTTIGTNALIERKGAPTGLVTTEGFRDVLEIARIERPDEGLYDFNVDTPAPLVPRSLRLGVRERIGAKGEIVTPLVEEDARRAARLFRENGIRTVAVSTLFSFKNPVHERRIREIFREEHPEALVSLSSEIAPEFREFERTSTTVINAYLAPIVERYLGTLQRLLAETYGEVEIRIMQASGGAVSAEMARSRAVATVNSGPAGGAVGSCFFGRLAGEERLITIDMGGTSFDIGLVDDGKPRITSDGKFEGYPVRVQQVDVHAIGAGGGSIAWIDRGGALCVGPRSAAAEPGPACYGRGGELPTVTDANLVLGRIAPDYFLGGEMRLHPELAASSNRRHDA